MNNTTPKHTLGPCKARQQWAGNKLMAIRIVKASEPYIGHDIASMELSSGFNTDTSMDYANLFAAAPELYNVSFFLEQTSDEKLNALTHEQLKNLFKDFRQEAKEAINKAKGL